RVRVVGVPGRRGEGAGRGQLPQGLPGDDTGRAGDDLCGAPGPGERGAVVARGRRREAARRGGGDAPRAIGQAQHGRGGEGREDEAVVLVDVAGDELDVDVV